MAMTHTKVGPGLYRYSETGAANTLLTATTGALGNKFRVVFTACTYSNTPTQAGVTTYFVTPSATVGVVTGTANATYTMYTPSSEIVLGVGDAVTVTAPAGGVGLTATVVIYIELL